MNKELCCECGEETDRAGRADDSLYLEFENGEEVGPLCEKCRSSYWVCDGCGYAVPDEHVTFDATHDLRYGGCGGRAE